MSIQPAPSCSSPGITPSLLRLPRTDRCWISSRRVKITRAVGGDDVLQLDIASDLVADGDRFLLCSDGLYSALSEAQMARFLQYDTPEEACRALVEAACEAGAPDNVTAVVVVMVRSLEQP